VSNFIGFQCFSSLILCNLISHLYYINICITQESHPQATVLCKASFIKPALLEVFIKACTVHLNKQSECWMSDFITVTNMHLMLVSFAQYFDWKI
jgi:hypothetical protein